MDQATKPDWVENPKPVEDMSNFEKLIEIAKKVKMDWVENTDRGDMPPTFFVERDGVAVAAVMAPQVDRNAGLRAAAACRKGFRATALTLILDAHVRMEKMPEGVENIDQAEHLQGCPDCQAHIEERVQPALRKVENNPVAAEQFRDVIEVAEDDFKKMQE